MTAGLDTDLAGLAAHVGSHLGYTHWREMTQERVDRFADVTEDHNYIHVDVERAAEGPFGGTVAHGYLTLSLLAPLVGELLRVEGAATAVNYGLDKLRFPSPLPVGDRVRMRARLDRVDEFPGGATVVVTLTFERAGGGKPVCVAEAVYRVFEETK
jgi:acyl dehydratase